MKRKRIWWLNLLSVGVVLSLALVAPAGACCVEDDDTYCPGQDGTPQCGDLTLTEECNDIAPKPDCCMKSGSRICPGIFLHCSYFRNAGGGDCPEQPPQ